ncbi:hypothetical protein ACIRP2_12540 [Streptomyces sp. NPDC101194]
MEETQIVAAGLLALLRLAIHSTGPRSPRPRSLIRPDRWHNLDEEG